jgi:tRNA G37 N-methylase TrmD
MVLKSDKDRQSMTIFKSGCDAKIDEWRVSLMKNRTCLTRID